MTTVVLGGIRKSYRTWTGTVDALRGIDLTVTAGESVAIMGPSGCGKSTLLGLIAGLEPPTAGSITLAGTRINGLDERARTLFRRRSVGLIFQSADLLPFLTAAENVDLALALLGHSDPALARTILTDLGLGSHADKLPDQLSGGQRQRVGIARALVHRPTLILADEPTGELDSAAAAAAMDLLQGVHRELGATLIVVTHDRTVAARLDRIVQLRDGLVVQDSETRAPVTGADRVVDALV